MENGGNIKFFCVVCGLQGTLLWDEGNLPGIMCPRCGSKVMTPHPVREKASVQLVCQ